MSTTNNDSVDLNKGDLIELGSNVFLYPSFPPYTVMVGFPKKTKHFVFDDEEDLILHIHIFKQLKRWFKERRSNVSAVHVCNKEDDIQKIKMDLSENSKDLKENGKDLKALCRAMNGNGKIGYFMMCKLTYDWMLERKKDRHDLIMIAYRVALIGLLGFLAKQSAFIISHLTKG